MRKCRLCGKVVGASKGPFFAVPTDKRRLKWSSICGINFKSGDRICGDHFQPSDIVQGPKKSTLLPKAEPFVVIEPSAVQFPICLPETDFECEFVEGMEFSLGFVEWKYEANPKITYLFFHHYCRESMSELPQVEIHTQPDPIELYCEMERILKEKQRYIENLEARVTELEIKLAESEKVVSCVRSIFTEGQLRKIISPGSLKWQWNDISSAICLHAAGPRAYRHLYNKGFPLPCVSTLQRWSQKINIREGILYPELDVMQHNSELAEDEKLCVIVFDEMKVVETYEYEAEDDRVRKPVNFVQVVMARGLRKSWKVPVFFKYDCPMDTATLFAIISAIHGVGFTVIATVCDMGPTNQKLWRCLGASKDRPWFPNPVDECSQIFTFADAPHLLKLLRNHFIDSGLICKGEWLTKRSIEELLKYTSSSDLSISHKINKDHITEPFGRNLEAQKRTLATMNDVVSQPMIPERKKLERFQKGILMTNNALLLMYDYLKDMNNMEYIVTYRLNQDILEHLFGALRYKGGLNDHPTPKEFKYRLRKYVLARNTERLQGTGNVEVDGTNWMNSNKPHTNSENSCTAAEINEHEAVCCQEYEENEEDEIMDIEGLDLVQIQDSDALQDDALEYISGYIIQKLNLDEHLSQENTFTWVDQVSKGSLKKPSQHFVRAIKELEKVFERINGKEIDCGINLRKRLFEKSINVDLPENVRKFFFKCRIFFRIKNLNRGLKIQKAKQKIMDHKKFSKIKL